MSVYPGQRFTFEHEGLLFVATIEHDYSHGAPWEECDGYFPVERVSHDYDKKPSEVFLFKGERRGYSYVYDIRQAHAIARRESWGAKDGMQTGETARQYAARAVRETAEFLRGWCADEWGYVGVIVHRADSEGEPIGEPESLWGVESCGDHAENEATRELASELIQRNRETRQKRKFRLAKALASVPNANYPFAPAWKHAQYEQGLAR